MYQSRCTAKNSWWWIERLPETCRVVIPIKLEFSASVGFIHRVLRSAEQSEPTPLEITVTILTNPTLNNELWHLEVATLFCRVEAPSFNFCKHVKFFSLSQRRYCKVVTCLARRRTQMFTIGDVHQVLCETQHSCEFSESSLILINPRFRTAVYLEYKLSTKKPSPQLW